MYQKATSFLTATGEALALLGQAFRSLPRFRFRWKTIQREMWIVGAQTLPLACFFLFLIGMVVALQTGLQLHDYGQEKFVGRLVSASMARELGPWMTAFVLVARNGSSTAAEIGTMSVSEEIAALRMMAIDPADFIVMPRLAAFLIMAPVITVIATGVGILGGLPVAALQLQVPFHVYLDEIKAGLEPALVIYWGILKALVFAVIAVTVACSFGLRTKGGALGVGRASRDTVVWSLVLIVFSNYILTSFYKVVREVIGGAE